MLRMLSPSACLLRRSLIFIAFSCTLNTLEQTHMGSNHSKLWPQAQKSCASLNFWRDGGAGTETQNDTIQRTCVPALTKESAPLEYTFVNPTHLSMYVCLCEYMEEAEQVTCTYQNKINTDKKKRKNHKPKKNVSIKLRMHLLSRVHQLPRETM